MRIYSNKYLSVTERMHLWRKVQFPVFNPFYKTENDIVYKVDEVYKNEITFFRTDMYTKPPINFTAQFAWEYPDKQIGVSPLDLRSFNLCRFGKIHQNAVHLPAYVKSDDLIYVHFMK